jgi:SAM-dependent methyltransferase
MLEEQGFPTAIYDPFYAPDTGVLTRTYDFVTCTETAEHFHTPRQEFQRLAQLLRPGGVLAVMTQILEDGTDFSQWRYAMDITHVCFYRSRTMEWIAAAFEFDLQRPHANVFFLRHRRDQHAPAHQRHPKNDPADPERRSSQ